MSVFSQLWLTVADLPLMRGFYERALFGRPPDMDTATSAFWTLGRDGAHAVSFALHLGEPGAPGGNGQPVLLADDLDAARALVLAEGGARLDPDPVVPRNVSRFVGMTVEQRLRDPEGNAFLLYAWVA